MGMPCKECGVPESLAEHKLDESVPHMEPILEIGPRRGPCLHISLLWIPGASHGK